MAIVKVTAPSSVPTTVADYQAQNAHIMAFMNQVNLQAFILTNPLTLDNPDIAMGAYISHGGNLYKVTNENYEISGSPSDGLVYVRVSGDATLTAEFIDDISGYAYNAAYGAITSGSYTLLPYEILKDGSDWRKDRYDASLSSYVGMIAPFGVAAPPIGWLLCDGASVSVSTYSRLHSVIGYAFGGSGGSFNLPELRGEFIRGLDLGRGIDAGRAFGSFQDHQMQYHRHRVYSDTVLAGVGLDTARKIGGSDVTYANSRYEGGQSNNSENRPRNIAFPYCIKY